MSSRLALIATQELIAYDGKASSQDIYAYQHKVGSLLYATTITRRSLRPPDRPGRHFGKSEEQELLMPD